MQSIKNAIIAAAGRGKRLGLGIPKCLVKINDIPIINYQLYLLKNIENVYLVVGYCEEDVIRYVKSIRKNVIFVRNPNFRYTLTLQSLYLAGKNINDFTLCLDGDMIIEETSFNNFINNCISNPTIAISDKISKDPVYVDVDNNFMVNGFSTKFKSDYEWANLAYIHSDWLSFEPIHFYQKLEMYLPLKSQIINCYEIDTQEDFQICDNFLKSNVSFCPHI